MEYIVLELPLQIFWYINFIVESQYVFSKIKIKIDFMIKNDSELLAERIYKLQRVIAFCIVFVEKRVEFSYKVRSFVLFFIPLLKI